MKNFAHKNEEYISYIRLTQQEMYDQLALARNHADEGMVKSADQVAEEIEQKYGF